MPANDELKTEALVIGSGAGGSITALELAKAGLAVVLVEEGERHSRDSYGRDAAYAMRTLYRRRGMTPILGSVPIGYVEGRCLGGSTEINSAFWHRTPAPVAAAWAERFGLLDATPQSLAPHFDWLEQTLSVGTFDGPLPSMSECFAHGARIMNWPAREIPRVVRQCACLRPCSSGCHTGGKQSMSRSLLPQAEAAGARIITNCRVDRLRGNGSRVWGALATSGNRQLRIDADVVVVCCGPTETPALLRRSGVTHAIGKRLEIHPMLKVAARFPFETGAATQPIPLLQIDGLLPRITLAGAHFSAGHLALHMSENWPVLEERMADRHRMAMFHVAARGGDHGTVAPALFGSGTRIRYDLSDESHRGLCRGTDYLIDLLFASGAEEVYPSIHGVPVITAQQRRQPLENMIHKSSLGLTTVHAFSTCPIGERQFRTAANSFGQVWGYDNLYINDASMLPSSPGVNPQGSIMALARRNALHLVKQKR